MEIKKDIEDDNETARISKLYDSTHIIKPPSFYETLEKRAKFEKDGPYTVEAIREALSRDILPAGYAEIQLSKCGFKPEVEALKERRDKQRKASQADLKKYLIQIKKNIIEGLPDLYDADQKAADDSGILNKVKRDKLVKSIDKWIEDTDKERMSVLTLDNLRSVARTRISIFKDTIALGETTKRLEQRISAATDAKEDQVLQVLRRNFGVKYGKSR